MQLNRIGVSGHQDIPSTGIRHIEDRIAGILRAFEGEVLGVTCLAKGADQLFGRLVLKHGGRLHVVIPSRNYETTFVTFQDRELYSRLLAAASVVDVLDFPVSSEDAFLAAGKRVVELSETLVAVWDGLPSKGKGGTADIVELARHVGRRIEVVWPAGLKR